MNTHRQFAKFAVVGLLSNVLLYLLYLLLTRMGIGYRWAMTVSYATGVCFTFLLNRSWTFRHEGHLLTSAVRYFVIYLLGYFFNFVGLYFFVEHLHFRHQFVQAVLIVLVALFLFTIQKFWVFGRNSPATSSRRV